MVYQRLDGADWDIYASALRADVRIAADNLSHLWVTGSANDEEYPVVDCNGHHFAVAYQRRFVAGSGDYDIYVSGVYLAGGAFRISEGPLNLAFSGSFEGYPEMASRYSAGTISDFCGVVWYDATPTGDIEGALYELPDNFGQVNVPYCSSNNNSTGVHGALSVTGSSIRARNELVLSAWQLPTNATLFFLTSLTSGFVQNPGGAAGNLCLGGNIGRYVGPGQIQNTGGAGQASLVLDLSQHPTPNGLVSVTAGQTWRFQAWHRDTNGSGGSTSNFTDASSVLFN
ncbi:MAG: hypothetical protein R3F49_18750 [Planctomycetota bacterium]